MKRIKFLSLLLTALFAFSALNAQPASVQSFVDKYSGQDGFTTINISPKMFSMLAAMSVDEEFDEFDGIIEKITGLNILVYEPEEGGSARDVAALYNEVANDLPKGYYEELMTVKDKESNVRFLIRETQTGIIDELLMLVSDTEEFVFLSLTGAIDLDAVIELSKKMDIEGFEHLEKMEEE
jgi:hypothetical protein